MTQGIAFARSIRALEADDFRSSKVGLAIAAVVFGAWTWWMLAARVPRYETATNVRIENGHAIATFPAIREIHPGQSALVMFDGAETAARVASVSSDRAELVFTRSQPPAANPESAEIETARVSPAEILLGMLKRGR
jgi:hypothetical protein